jgi:hypothetical protein
MSQPQLPYLVAPARYDPATLGRFLKTREDNLVTYVEKRVKAILADPKMTDPRTASAFGTRGNQATLDLANRPAPGEVAVAKRGDRIIMGGSGAAMSFTDEGETASVSTTDLVIAGAHRPGIYRVVCWVAVTAGAVGGAVTVTIGWTDEVGATTAAAITALTATTATRGSGAVVLYSDASAAITVATTVTGTPTHNLRVACERVL